MTVVENVGVLIRGVVLTDPIQPKNMGR